MEVVHGAPEDASPDFISSMPDKVIINILNRLPIEDAVKTGVLARNWRLRWFMVTELVLDAIFCSYLCDRRIESDHGSIFRDLISHLKGPLTKFALDVFPSKLSVTSIGHRVLDLSSKGIKDLTLNCFGGPLKLSSHLYSCVELERLKLINCIHWKPSFDGFPKLLSLDLSKVTFESCVVGKFIARCPLLEILKIHDCGGTRTEEILIEIAKLGKLKILSLRLEGFFCYAFRYTSAICSITTSGAIFNIWFGQDNELLAVHDARKKVPNGFLSLKTVKLSRVDFSDNILVPWIIELISGSPNLYQLEIRAYSDVLYEEPGILHLDCDTMGQLHLQSVMLSSYQGSEDEDSLIKFILACSPRLKKIVIEVDEDVETVRDMASNLLNLYRASPVVQIELC